MDKEEIRLIDEEIYHKEEEGKKKCGTASAFLARLHIITLLEIVAVLFVVIFIPYIIMQNKVSVSNGPAVEQAETSNIFSDLKVDDVHWMTIGGGFPSNLIHEPLFSGRDDEKISGILDILKTGSDYRKLQNSKLPGGIGIGGGSVGLYIKLKNGSKYFLFSAYNTEENTENSTQLTPLADRFMITNTETNEHYTVFSKEAAKYIVQGFKADFHFVNPHSITPEDFKVGDKITITGKGTTADEAEICLVTADSEPVEKHIIAKVTPKYGEWKWEGDLNRNLKTFDGQYIPFSDRIMYLTVNCGDRNLHPLNRLNFAETEIDTTGSEKKSYDFYFYLNYRIGEKYEFFNDTITKYIKGQFPVTTTLKLTKEDMNAIYKEMKAIDIESYPDHNGQITFDNDTDYNYYQIKVTIDGVVKNLYLQDKDGAQDEKTVKLRKLFLNIHEIISAKEEFKQLP